MDQSSLPLATQNQPGLSQAEKPMYERPTIKVMSEKDILSMFQVTQSMGAWWTVPSC